MKRNYFLVFYVIFSILLTLSCSKKETDPAENPTSVPNAPKDLKVTNIDASSVKLDWTDASDNEKGFRINRFSYLSGFATDINVPANTATYTDGGLTPYT